MMLLAPVIDRRAPLYCLRMEATDLHAHSMNPNDILFAKFRCSAGSEGRDRARTGVMVESPRANPIRTARLTVSLLGDDPSACHGASQGWVSVKQAQKGSGRRRRTMHWTTGRSSTDLRLWCERLHTGSDQRQHGCAIDIQSPVPAAHVDHIATVFVQRVNPVVIGRERVPLVVHLGSVKKPEVYQCNGNLEFRQFPGPCEPVGELVVMRC